MANETIDVARKAARKSMSAARKTARATADSFQNFAAKTGLGTDNLSSANTYGFNPVSRNRTLIEWMYRGSWICGVAVDCVADDMTREGVEFQSSLEPEEGEQLQAALSRHQVWQSLNQVAKWARLYGGAIGYISIKGQDPATPLRLETVAKGQFEGVTTMDRWMVQPDLVHSIKTPGPDFGLPLFYDVVATSFQFPFPRARIHHSRLIRMEGVELPYFQRISENMWGMSILERVYDRLTAFDSTTSGAAQLTYRAHLRTIKVKDLRTIIATGGKTMEGLVAQLEMIRRYQSNEGLTLLDGEDEFETHSYTFSGLADVLNAMADQISGATQIPLARLFGQSPGGLNATGDHELITYYDNVKRQQERWFRRPLDIVLRVSAASEEIELPEGFAYTFKSLWQTTDEEKSTINANDANAISNLQGAGIIGKAVALKELRQQGRATGRWSNISDQDITDAEAEDAAPTPQELGLLGPDGKPKPGGEQGAEEEEGKGGLNIGGNKDASPSPVAPKASTRFAGQSIKAVEATYLANVRSGKDPDAPDMKEMRAHIGYLRQSKDAARIFDFHGLPIHIETAAGEIRRGGKGTHKWQIVLPMDYGFIAGRGSAEGAFEELDCFVGNRDASADEPVVVINQKKLGSDVFDEHKIMFGCGSEQGALDAYESSYNLPVEQIIMNHVTFESIDDFKGWLDGFDRNQPCAG